MLMKRFLSLFSLAILLTACGGSDSPVALSDPSENPDQLIVTSFDECVLATGVVMESYPRQCRFEDMLFIEELSQIEPAEGVVPGEEMMVFLESGLQDYLSIDQAIDIQVDQQADDHVRGTFQPDGETAGALFLAAWLDGEWEIAYAGNGAISCADLEEYAFPEEMISDCNQ